MQVYLVGGAVRDELLGLEITELDWVVVGATPKNMQKLGYKAVGKDFPVFLHPDSKEEYALARTERKQGRGYHGFEFHTSPEVTLEEDLRRRDLTINAIAKSKDGAIIDPYGGQADLKNKVLRHVSDAFAEDPLRVLRVARFAAKLHKLGFSIADETKQLMLHIVTTREILELSPERIWQETRKALTMPSPEQFFLVLHQVKALAQTHTNICDEFNDPNSRQYALSALQSIATSEHAACIRLAAFLGGLYFNNTDTGIRDTQALCENLSLPKACKELLLLTVGIQHKCHEVFELDEKQLLRLLREMDTRRKPERFAELLKIYSVLHNLDKPGAEYPQAEYLLRASQIIENIDIDKWIREKVGHEELASNIQQAQQAQLQKLIQEKNSWINYK